MTAPLTFGQQQLWFIDEFHHGLPAHNVPHQLRLTGPLDENALRLAMERLVAAHPALRTRLAAGGDGVPVQVIDAPRPVRIERVDFEGSSAGEAAERLSDYAIAQARTPFQVAKAWPIRATLVRLSDKEHALVLVMHQLAFDEASLRVLLTDLAALYEAETAGSGAVLPELPLTFAQYAVAERQRLAGPALDELEKYWTATLADLPATRFPADRARPLLASHDGDVEAVTIGPDLRRGLHAVSDRAGVPLWVTLLAAAAALLYRYTGQTDLVIGTAAPNRDDPARKPLIGYVENVLPIRVDASGDPSFAELLGRVEAAVDGAVAHQDLPFAKIVDALGVERDTGRFPVFQTWLRYHEPVAEVTAGGVAFRPEPVRLLASRYDIAFDARPAADGLLIEATYTPALFDAATVRRLLGHLQVLLGGVAAEPRARLSRLPVLTEAEYHREVVEWNDTKRTFPQICLHEGFERQAERTPEAIAAEFEADQISYRDLDQRAGQIAGQLREAGVAPETLVGVCMPVGIARLAVLLGIWKAGGGYVPLDSGLPAERLAYMITDTGMKLIVTDAAGAPSLPSTSATVLTVDDQPAAGQPAGAHDRPSATPASVAYVIYTSGSTGQPKGVVIEHRHAINFLHGMIEAWHITPSSAVLQFAAYTFDVSVMDMFMPLLAGARVVMAPKETLHSPPRLAALIRDSKITFACLPPAVLSLLVGEKFPDLRTLLSAGEELTSELLRSWQRDDLEIYNGYGPTECAIGSTFMRLEPTTKLPPPIGRPKPNYQAYVLDEHLNPVPVGVTGELHIGGAGVGRGYLNRPELTRERFIDDPFGDVGSGGAKARLYKTGDLVRRRLDGTLEFVGRIDDQVKINGLRVELGEIEAALTSYPGVSQAVVVVITNQAGKKQLAGYLRPAEPGDRPRIADLRAHLAGTLPGYMIPSYLITLDELPLTANKKIDKAALPPPESVAAAAERVPPRTLIETVLVDLYATILGDEQIGAADSFFDAGGNSLQALQLVAQLYAALAVDLDVSAVFLAPTARQLAAVLRDKHGFDDAELDDEHGIEDLVSHANAD
ncbi:MAG TPA: amino acid adenylation domain-containing protein [Streptosporangiaceae bacterium]|nr:amino acid adenylation domain-containing protein [Streptosporangiaceae bacterium]